MRIFYILILFVQGNIAKCKNAIRFFYNLHIIITISEQEN